VTRVLALDVGGTNARLAIAEADARSVTIESREQSPTRDFPSFEAALLAHAGWFRKEPIAAVAIACAGPVEGGVCHMTNLGWTVDAHAIERTLGLPTRVLNDFAAIALGARFVPPAELATLQAGEHDASAPVAILGAGTGLGEALVIPTPQGDRVIATEGGHATLAPFDDSDAPLIAFIRKEMGGGHVSVERVLSGAGLVNIFEWMEAAGIVRSGEALRARMKAEDPAGAIGAMGTDGTDPAARAAVDRFVRFYGSEAGNLALKSIPRGGLYVAGGIAAKILPRVREGFVGAFLEKGRMRPLLESIPVHVILDGAVGLRGAAAAAAVIAAS
jgi:glucokinase